MEPLPPWGILEPLAHRLTHKMTPHPNSLIKRKKINQVFLPTVKCKVCHSDDATSDHPRNPLFNPHAIIHPCSTDWVRCPEAVDYVQAHLRKGFEKMMCNKVHIE
ncbi:hypothetical protein NDU88_005764 [Pleurodeles waltl]|uniref:Uncharacterized protein n=1 Tax=Pleurodeles waltl TaxID=8319 RepID=A0AAV7TCJ8_PLEWA|nr:hypothetical protein NDU88_005764 [Pleurodeles waltl]